MSGSRSSRREEVTLPLQARFPSRPDSLASIRDAVERVVRACGMDETAVQDIRIAVSEAATNAIIHGGAPEDAEVHLRVERLRGELLIVIADQGHGMRPRTDSPGLGLGLPIISGFARRMEVISRGALGGAEVHMAFPMNEHM